MRKIHFPETKVILTEISHRLLRLVIAPHIFALHWQDEAKEEALVLDCENDLLACVGPSKHRKISIQQSRLGCFVCSERAEDLPLRLPCD